MPIAAPPDHLMLKTEMVLRRMKLKDVAKRAGLKDSVASMVLNGRRVSPATLERLRVAIMGAPVKKGGRR